VGARENEALVREYLGRVTRGDPAFADLLADDVAWWTPPGTAHGGGSREGKEAVLAFIRHGSAKYSSRAKFELEIEAIVANDDWACAQLVLRTETARGAPYVNYLHIAFRIRGGRIALGREYSDTLLAFRSFTPEELA
jgi:ketosteroid isomerase-like protein